MNVLELILVKQIILLILNEVFFCSFNINIMNYGKYWWQKVISLHKDLYNKQLKKFCVNQSISTALKCKIYFLYFLFFIIFCSFLFLLSYLLFFLQTFLLYFLFSTKKCQSFDEVPHIQNHVRIVPRNN